MILGRFLLYNVGRRGALVHVEVFGADVGGGFEVHDFDDDVFPCCGRRGREDAGSRMSLGVKMGNVRWWGWRSMFPGCVPSILVECRISMPFDVETANFFAPPAILEKA
jgi:hypothetical protein